MSKTSLAWPDDDDLNIDEEELEYEDKVLGDFDFELIFKPGEKPKFDKSILDTEVGNYEE